MAIHAYVGKPGSGKSYGVVERVVIPSLKQGRHVVTNIELNVDELLADFGGTIEILPHDWWERPDLGAFTRNGCVLILDELWRRWPSGQKANMVDKSLLAEHRHMVDDKGNSMRIVLVTQDLSQLGSWARTLIETTFVIKKFSKKAYRVNSYSGVVTGDSPPKSRLIRQAAGKYNSDIYRYYKSATKSQTGDVGDESVADKTGSFLRSYTLWAFIVLFVVGLSFGVPAVTSFFKAPLSTKAEQPKESPPSTLKNPQSQAIPVKPQVVYSSNWRLSGFVHPSQTDPNSVRDSSVAVLVSPYGRTRYIAFSGCRYFSDFKEAYCDIDGERITTWTAGGSSSQIPFIGGLGGGTAERSVSGTGG